MPPVPARLIYFLDFNTHCRLQVSLGYTRVMKWSRFERWGKPLASILRRGSGVPIELSPEDRRIVPRLLQYQAPENDLALLDGPDGFEIAKAMVATQRAFWDRGTQLRLSWGSALSVEPTWQHDAAGVPHPGFTGHKTVPLAATTPPLALGQKGRFDCLRPLTSAWPKAALAAWVRPPMGDVATAERFLSAFVQRFPQVPPPVGEEAPSTEEAAPYTPTPVLRWMLRDGGMAADANELIALDRLALLRVRFRYGNKEVDWHDDRPRVSLREEGVLRIVARAADDEQGVIQQLRDLGLQPRAPDATAGLFDFHAQDFERPANATATLEAQIAALRDLATKHGWELDHSALLVPPENTGANWSAVLSQDDKGWFHFSASLRHEGQTIPLLPLLRDFLRQHREETDEAMRDLFMATTFALRLQPGEPPVLVPGDSLRLLFDRLFELRTSTRLDRAGRLRVSRWRAIELEAEELSDEPLYAKSSDTSEADHEAVIEARRKWHTHLAKGETTEWPEWEHLPDSLRGLRTYQRQALGWMRFLRETETHGVLADDMGLGKTFQMLAHLACEYDEGQLKGPILVVCPTSVLDNWIQECERRTPSIAFAKHHGPGRAKGRDALLADKVGIVTSYALLREDAGLLAGLEWSCVILDEAQAIKNPRSETHRIACQLRARRRFCLTGTPIENHLRELWALFEFLMPRYLGSRDAFREDFEGSAATTGTNEHRRLLAQLRRRVQPFILRRTKEAVAPELPSKTEILHHVEMTPAQAQCYEAARLSTTRDLRRIFEERGVEQSRMHVLEALTRLRLICCDPRLDHGGNENDGFGPNDSAKLVRLLEILEELLEEGRRCLIFSQFVKVLDLIAPALGERGWQHLQLDGRTQNRGALVEAFEAGEAPIFLISLRAGGSGLNLTSADSVIHFDPWWNPAVEDQATDRVHRIGQDKPVFVHRLVTEESIESGILALHHDKRQLANDVLDFGQEGGLTLDREWIARLLGDEEGALPPKSSSS